MNIKEAIVDFMKEQAYKPMNIKELERVFCIKKTDTKNFKKIVDEIEREGNIVKTRTNRYGIPDRMGLVTGKFQGHQKGYGFVIPYDGDKDIFVPSSSLNGAMNGDKVVVKITKQGNTEKK